MRTLPFAFWAVITFVFIYFLSHPFGQIPALGKLLSPTVGFWQNLEGETPNLPTEISSANLSESVEVVWDENLIPHIYAANETDLYYVQGYITAQMRLWQMDFQSRAAAGRISEVVGDAALEYDKSMRRKGMLIGAQKNTEFIMQSEYAAHFETYAAGVNDYIKTLTPSTLPLEYKLLSMQPEEWSPFKSMLLLEFMTNMLSTHNNDIEYTNFLNTYGIEAWQKLYGGLDNAKDPIIEKPEGWDFEPVTIDPIPTDVQDIPADFVGNQKPDPDNGSNNWAVSPERTANGNALLANDPHLGLNLPSLWFAVHLQAGDLNVFGASLPGTPAVIIGFNEKTAWGFTNSQRDLVDWYRVEFADPSKKHILVDGQKEALQPFVEEIKVKGGETVFDTIYLSSFGLIANYSELDADSKTGWAYRWIGQDLSETALSFIKLNHGSGLADYMKAADHFYAPGQNIVFADVKGNIALRVQGKYLLRAENEGLFLRDGTKSANQWNQFIPFEQNPTSVNPERGFVSSANQFPVDSAYPYFITASKFEVYRNRRINNVLRKDSMLTVEDFKALQLDNYNLEAAENLSTMLAALEFQNLNQHQKEVFEMLMNWGYKSDADLMAPAYYDAWRNEILKLAWDEMGTAKTRMIAPTSHRTFKLLREEPEAIWWDILSTEEKENSTQLITQAFKNALLETDDWKKNHGTQKLAFNWGNFKGTQITHLSRQKALSQPAFTGGNKGIVNATSKTHGPSWRQIVELDSTGIKALGIYPGGQSGNPGSQFYVNFVNPWAAGQYLELDVHATEQSLESKTLAKTTFKSAK